MGHPASASSEFGGVALAAGQRAAPAYGRDADTPLAGLAGSSLSGRFRHWHGASGRRYLFSVFPLGVRCALDPVPRYEEAVILAVRREQDGTRMILLAADTGRMPDVLFGGHGLRDALASGANEIHMHLLADHGPSRQAIVEDLEGR